MRLSTIKLVFTPVALVAHWISLPAQAGQFCFSTTPYEVQASPSHVMQGDFNGDGMLDLVAANHQVGEDTVSLLVNNGDGTFAPAVHAAVDGRPYWLGVGDLDGDGDADAIVSNFFGHTVAVLLNDSAGVFAAPVHYPVGFFPTFAIVADLDGDFDLDIAVANAADSTVSVLMNNGDGTFAKQVPCAVGVNPYGVTAGDFNNDNALDLAVANYDADADAISILMNNGDGTFAEQVNYPVSDAPVGIDNADLNGDGYADLVVCIYGPNAENNIVEVKMNDGAGGFLASMPYTVGVGPYAVELEDLNDDGARDIVSANTGIEAVSGDVSVLINNGDGTFGAAQSYSAGGGPGSVAVGDLDGNTTPELAVAAYGDFNIFVLFNQFPAITQDPSSRIVEDGATAVFTVAVTGPEPFTFQWRRDGVDLVDGGNVSGANSDTLTVQFASAGDAGLYDVVVANDCGSLTSAAADLEIETEPTCSEDIAPQPKGNGIVDVDDLLAVINSWGGCEGPEPCVADIAPSNGNGVVDVDDLLAVINAWGPCK